MQDLQIKIFITGIYRSGTTLISRILNNHSRLWITYDSVHFMRFSYNCYNPIYLVENAEKLIKETHNRILKRWNMDFDINSLISNVHRLKEIDYRTIYELIMKELAFQYKNKATGWGEKTNVCWGQIPNFLKIFPEGKTIHVVRDPRDVMCSYKRMTYEPGYAYLDSAFASLHSFTSAKKYKEKFSAKNYYCIRYEDMVNKPEQIIKSLCTFLEIEFEANMINASDFVDKIGKKWSGESSYKNKYTEISKSSLNKWEKHATPIEIYLVELINRPIMPEFGYTLSGVLLDKKEWNELYNILQDPLIHARYKNWLKTGKGVEAYPSDPLKVSY